MSIRRNRSKKAKTIDSNQQNKKRKNAIIGGGALLGLGAGGGTALYLNSQKEESSTVEQMIENFEQAIEDAKPEPIEEVATTNEISVDLSSLSDDEIDRYNRIRSASEALGFGDLEISNYRNNPNADQNMTDAEILENLNKSYMELAKTISLEEALLALNNAYAEGLLRAEAFEAGISFEELQQRLQQQLDQALPPLDEALPPLDDPLDRQVLDEPQRALEEALDEPQRALEGALDEPLGDRLRPINVIGDTLADPIEEAIDTTNDDVFDFEEDVIQPVMDVIEDIVEPVVDFVAEDIVEPAVKYIEPYIEPVRNSLRDASTDSFSRSRKPQPSIIVESEEQLKDIQLILRRKANRLADGASIKVTEFNLDMRRIGKGFGKIDIKKTAQDIKKKVVNPHQ